MQHLMRIKTLIPHMPLLPVQMKTKYFFSKKITARNKEEGMEAQLYFVQKALEEFNKALGGK